MCGLKIYFSLLFERPLPVTAIFLQFRPVLQILLASVLLVEMVQLAKDSSPKERKRYYLPTVNAMDSDECWRFSFPMMRLEDCRGRIVHTSFSCTHPMEIGLEKSLQDSGDKSNQGN